jgi:competence protein ComEC
LLASGGLWFGAIAGNFPRALTIGFVIFIAASILIASGRNLLPKYTALLLVLALGVGFFISVSRYLSRHNQFVTSLAQRHAIATVTLTITTDPVARAASVTGSMLRPASISLDARLSRIQLSDHVYVTRVPVLVIADRKWLGLLPGTRVVIEVSFVPTLADLAATVRVRGPPQIIAMPNVFERWAGRIRSGLYHSADSLAPDPRGLLPGLVIGDTSRVSRALNDDMRTTGLTHLVAVSGANLAIVAALVMALLRRTRVARRFRPPLAVVAIALFVIVVRPQPSVLRAAAMACVVLVAAGLGVKASAVPALATAIFILLLIDPTQAISYGFALSVFATAGLLLLAPSWSRALERHMPRWLAQAIAIPLAAQAMCAPLIVALSGQVSIIAVVANALAGPLVAPATILGLGTALVSQININVATFTAHLAALPTMLISGIAHRCAALPFAAIAWPKSLLGVLLLAAITVALIVLAKRVTPSRRVLITTLAVAISFLIPSLSHPGWPPKDWTLLACDVGQGDGLLLNLGKHSAIVIDAGPEVRLIEKCLDELKITIVPLVILTHDHADHVEGLPGVLHHRKVGAIWITPLDEPSGEFHRILKWAKQIPITHVHSGIRIQIGGYRIETLWPNGIEDSPNNASIATLITKTGANLTEMRLFLGGDLEAPAQANLLASWRLHPEWGQTKVDVLKICHHGSSNQDPDFLVALSPRVAVISVGKGNMYGHPADSTLAALERLGVFVARTDQSGSVAVAQRAQGLVVVARGHRAWDARRR